MFRFLLVLVLVVTCSLGTKGGATTFALAKVKNAIGRIGIFCLNISSA